MDLPVTIWFSPYTIGLRSLTTDPVPTDPIEQPKVTTIMVVIHEIYLMRELTN